MIEALAEVIERSASEQARVLLAIDGPDAAGKTTFADAVVEHLAVPWIRASVDGFHRPRTERMERGPLSPTGYFYDSFNYAQLLESLLLPFQTGARLVRSRTFDWRADAPVEQDLTPVPERAVLVFDGVFLLRPELRGLWDLSVYLHVPSTVVLERALLRDGGAWASPGTVRERYESRYLPAQALYRSECDPERHADVLLDNSDFCHPVLLRPRNGLWMTPHP